MATGGKFAWMLAGGLMAFTGLWAVGNETQLAHGDSKGHEPVEGPGKDAASPSEIPVSGRKEIIKRVAETFSKDRIMENAAGVTFYAILALFPALGALVSLYGLFSTPSGVEDQVKAISGIIPTGGMQVISDQLHS